MSEEELIRETMMLDYSQLVMHNVYMIKENKRLENIIKEAREYIESYGITKEQLKKMSFGSAAPISIGEMLNILEILDKENK